MTKLMVTAQRLSDGRVVYLTADRRWIQRDHDAWITDDEAEVEAALAWAAQQTEVVVDPYRIEVDVDGSAIRHRSAREQIRAAGPRGILAKYGPAREALRAAVG